MVDPSSNPALGGLHDGVIDPERKGEVIGQVEYVHDLANGREFVVRGYRIRVGEVSPDGTLAFTSTKEGSS